MKILKRYKKSTKFICRKCGYPVLAKNGSTCARGGICSPCIEGTRSRLNWKNWKCWQGMNVRFAK